MAPKFLGNDRMEIMDMILQKVYFQTGSRMKGQAAQVSVRIFVYVIDFGSSTELKLLALNSCSLRDLMRL